MVRGSSSDDVLTYNDHVDMRYVNNKSFQIGNNGGDIASWRLVSQGMRLSLLNNAEENDGWFETCRLKTSRDPLEWIVMNKNVRQSEKLSPATQTQDSINEYVGGDPLVIAPKLYRAAEEHGVVPGDVLNTVMDVDMTTLIQHPTYRTGKLRDIHKFNFTLKEESHDHEFLKYDGSFEAPGELDAEPYLFWGPADGGSYSGRRMQPHADARRVIDQVIDPTWDILIVRVHGRPSTGDPSRILCHLVANQEICYSNGTALARFHTETHKSSPPLYLRGSVKSYRTRKQTRRKNFRGAVRRTARFGSRVGWRVATRGGWSGPW